MRTVLFCSILLVAVVTVSCKDTAAKANMEAKTNQSRPAVKPETAVVKIEGMTCAIGCAKAIEDKLNETSGVQQAKVDFDKKEAIIDFDLDKLQTADLKSIIESTADGESYKVIDVALGKKR